MQNKTNSDATTGVETNKKHESELTAEQLEQVSGGKLPQMDPQGPPTRYHPDPRNPPTRQ